MRDVPVIDLSDLAAASATVAAELDRACRELGFFVIVGHGVEGIDRLDALAREFFALGEEEKDEVSMARGGRAWRGWFPLGGELTSGVADQKEGYYFGAEGPSDGRLLHGPNLFPARPAGLADAVHRHMDQMTRLGRRLVELIEEGAGWAPDSLTRLVVDPVVLFRIFSYPPTADSGWGVAEHTDYGLLTILHQDDLGGLEVRIGPSTDAEWLVVPPIPGALVCNIGDMLERATGGAYRSTPHRVRNTTDATRLSMPFFLDPGWDARVEPLERPAPGKGAGTRWDGADPLLFEGSYGEYLSAKVAKVFPELGADELDEG
ncbi:MAG TPA: 2-oxoglutarate and iron-dependent oxygenase domain-containing protein [Microthrixaceae bacterium]|nr:2-oxoglutarate and iron-dependent oxygenase domain-containing protein [Microthrixaceae bacterium]